MRQAGFWILIVLAFLALVWVLAGNSLMVSKIFSPLHEQVRRETFEQSKAYRQGMVQELQNMQFEYIAATPEQQQALRSIILHRAADTPADVLPPDLNNFIEGLK